MCVRVCVNVRIDGDALVGVGGEKIENCVKSYYTHIRYLASAGATLFRDIGLPPTFRCRCHTDPLRAVQLASFYWFLLCKENLVTIMKKEKQSKRCVNFGRMRGNHSAVCARRHAALRDPVPQSGCEHLLKKVGFHITSQINKEIRKTFYAR